MLNAIKSLAYAGAGGRSPEIFRRTVLVNASGLSAAGVTLTYQVFYLVWGLADYPWVVGVNTVALLVYLSLPSLNRADRHDLACNLLTAVACIQLFVVDLLLGIGTQLFYFVFIGFLPFMYHRQKLPALAVLGAGILGLFLAAHFTFTGGIARQPLPESVLNVMYGYNAACTMGITVVLLYLFRGEIGRVEAELGASNRALAELSTTDELTRVLNRRGMQVVLYREWHRMRREGRPLTLLMCDVDHFKLYNDHYGHPAGDAVLRQIADMLGDAIRQPSDVVARYGGEEFVLILPGANAADGRVVAERIVSSVQASGIVHAHSPVASVITVSVGVSTLKPDETSTATALLDATDRALYQAKHAGRNRVAISVPPVEAECRSNR